MYIFTLFSTGFRIALSCKRERSIGHITSYICSVLLQQGGGRRSFNEVINGFCVGKSNGSYWIYTDTQIQNKKENMYSRTLPTFSYGKG